MTDIGSKTQQKNLVMPTFLNMPLTVANQVLEKMEPMDLLRARKVCRSLRTAVDKFGLRFDCINLFLEEDELRMNLSGTNVRYTTAANGNSNVIHNEQEKLIDGENFVERAAKDFKIISEQARKIGIWNISEDRCIVTTFVEFLKSHIHVEEIDLSYFSSDEFLTILPCFHAKWLNIIELICNTPIDRFERIAHLEQWENAEVVKLWYTTIASTMIVHFFHFVFFRIHQMDEFSEQTALQIRDDLLRRNTFQGCEIYFENSKSKPIEIAKVFKSDYAGGNEFEIEFSNGNDKFDIFLKSNQTILN